MNITSIDCVWINRPPDVFSREVIVTLPSKPNTKATIRGMGTINGEIGNFVGKVDAEFDGDKLYSTIKRQYAFRDLARVRFTGPLTSQSWRLIHDFSVVVLKHDDQISVAIEFPITGMEIMATLNQILKEESQLVDDACMVIKIPSDGGQSAFDSIVQTTISALMGCIVALRSQNLRTISLFMVIDDESSIDVAIKCIDMIKDTCMGDDTVTDAIGLALGSFIIAIAPVSSTETTGMIASAIREKLKDDLFEDSRVLVMQPSRFFESLGI